MQYKCIHQPTVLKKITRVDNLFRGSYTIDPYQNCEFGCMYCDSTFDNTVYITCNAPQILKKEKEKLNKKAWVILGSVHDPYQPVEEKYEITKNLITYLQLYKIPTHILTKSTLVLRDLDILKKMDNIRVTFSIPSFDGLVHQRFEGITPAPQQRLQAMQKIAEHQIQTGIAIIPIMPSINDSMPALQHIIEQSIDHHASYILHQYLELKGDQKNQFLNLIKKYYPHLLSLYNSLFEESIKPNESYMKQVNNRVNKICHHYKITTALTEY